MWSAFILLQCAKPKGQPKFRYKSKYFQDRHAKDDEEKDDNSDEDEYERVRLHRQRSCLCCCCCPRYSCCRGDRLVNFLFYDLFCFGLAAGFYCAFVFKLHPLWIEAQLRETLVFVQVIYGLLNFPFLLFVWEPCVLFLSKSRETGYDRDGLCLPKYLASDLYKLRFGKKQIVVDSKGVHLKVEPAIKKVDKKDPIKPDDVKLEGKTSSFGLEVDVADILRLENVFKFL